MPSMLMLAMSNVTLLPESCRVCCTASQVANDSIYTCAESNLEKGAYHVECTHAQIQNGNYVLYATKAMMEQHSI